MFKKALKYLIVISILSVLSTYYIDDWAKTSVAPHPEQAEPKKLTQDSLDYILYGDGTSGGHKHGANVACKTEFPADWSDQKVIETVKKIAANDNLDWRREDNGYYVTEAMEDGVKVRVVLDGKKRVVVTGYPVNLPRNPCPARGPANDP